MCCRAGEACQSAHPLVRSQSCWMPVYEQDAEPQVPPEAGAECAWMVIVLNSAWLPLPQALCARKG